MDTLSSFMPNVIEYADLFPQAIADTLIMLVVTGVISFIIGLPVAVLVVITRPGGLCPNKPVFWILERSSTCFGRSPL